MSPEWLVDSFKETQGRIDGSTATFGAPFYGERLLGRLVWGETKNKSRPHCSVGDYEVPEPIPVKSSGGREEKVRLKNFVMVRRGGCSFVTKVRIASYKGAHAVIVVDTEGSDRKPSDIREIIMSSDGYGSNITIPSILITDKEGQLLINAAKTAQVIIELAWDVPLNHVVVMDLWMSSASHESMRFLQEFAPKRKSLNERVKFVPHYHVFNLQAGRQEDLSNLCDGPSGRFCAEDPDGPGPITGRMVLQENLRQLCIHELTKVKRTDPNAVGDTGNVEGTVEYAAKFWDYVEQLLRECPLDGKDSAQAFGRACSEALMRKVGINVDEVNQCMLTTRGEKLKKEMANKAWSTRALRINGWKYGGTVDADLVMRAICAAFKKQPPACASLAEPVKPSSEQLAEIGGISTFSFIAALLVVAGVLVGIMFLYKRSLTRHIHSALREEVMLEVQSQMDTYRQMPA
jgi:hypothetical protein